MWAQYSQGSSAQQQRGAQCTQPCVTDKSHREFSCVTWACSAPRTSRLFLKYVENSTKLFSLCGLTAYQLLIRSCSGSPSIFLIIHGRYLIFPNNEVGKEQKRAKQTLRQGRPHMVSRRLH